MTDLPRDIEIELVALADGSLTGERRERALERVQDSSDLQSALAEQRRAVELTAAVDVRAPASLHRQVEVMLTPKRDKRAFAARRIGFAATAVAAVAAAAIAIGVSGGGSSSPGLSLQRTATLTLSPATMPAPPESSGDRAQLAASVGGVPFPYWNERFGWRGSGARGDRIAGRSVTTVFYVNAAGQRIGYAIASGPAPTVKGGTVVWRSGEPYRVLGYDGSTVVTWQRDGHMCVVSGRGVSAHTLLSLASWDSERSRAA